MHIKYKNIINLHVIILFGGVVNDKGGATGTTVTARVSGTAPINKKNVI